MMWLPLIQLFFALSLSGEETLRRRLAEGEASGAYSEHKKFIKDLTPKEDLGNTNGFLGDNASDSEEEEDESRVVVKEIFRNAFWDAGKDYLMRVVGKESYPAWSWKWWSDNLFENEQFAGHNQDEVNSFMAAVKAQAFTIAFDYASDVSKYVVENRKSSGGNGGSAIATTTHHDPETGETTVTTEVVETDENGDINGAEEDDFTASYD